MAADHPSSDVLDALDALAVRFSEGRVGEAVWHLAATSATPVDTTFASHQRDAALLVSLRSLHSMGGLPSGLAARNAACWQAALFALQEVKAALVAGGDRPHQPEHTECKPGYAACCRQVREGVTPGDSVRTAGARCGIIQKWLPAAPA